MTTKTLLQRQFLLLDGKGRNVDAKAVLHHHEGNRKPYFAITSQNGAAHEAILAAATPEVAEDLEALVAVHLRDADGVPMHAMADAAYHLAEDRYAEAHRKLGAGTLEDLYVVKGKAMTRFGAEVEPTLAAALDKIKEQIETAQKAQEQIDRAGKRHRVGESMFPASRKLEKERDEAMDLVRQNLFRKDLTLREAVSLLKEGMPTRSQIVAEARELYAKGFKRKCLDEALEAHVEAVCRPVWQEQMAMARAALEKPDYLAPGRPRIDQDPNTFEGFMASQGLTMSSVRDHARRDPEFPNASHWTVTLFKGDESMSFAYSMGSAHKGLPTGPAVLECIQSDISCIEGRGLDEFLEELGYATADDPAQAARAGIKPRSALQNIRRGTEAYNACGEQRDKFRALLGEEAYRHFMTQVGDNPPFAEDHFGDAPGAGV